MYKFFAVALVALSLTACSNKEEAVEPVVEPIVEPVIEPVPAVEEAPLKFDSERIPGEGVSLTADPTVAN